MPESLNEDTNQQTHSYSLSAASSTTTSEAFSIATDDSLVHDCTLSIKPLCTIPWMCMVALTPNDSDGTPPSGRSAGKLDGHGYLSADVGI